MSSSPNNIRTYGDLTKAGSFRKADLNLIRKPQYQDNLRHHLRKMPVPLTLHFVNAAEPVRGMAQLRRHIGNPNRVGLLELDEIKRMYGADIEPASAAVNFVLVENESQTRYPLTPWIIAHRLSHAFHYTNNRGSPWYIKVVKQIEHDITNQLTLQRPYGAGLEWFSGILGTAAGRAGIDDYIEFWPEVFASWCIRRDLPIDQNVLNPVRPDWQSEVAARYYGMMFGAVGRTVVL